jgi:hypothetical protein
MIARPVFAVPLSPAPFVDHLCARETRTKSGRDFTQDFEFLQSVAPNCRIRVSHVERLGQRRQF